MTSISLALDRIHPSRVSDDAAGMACPRCHACLSIHQPDQELPDRLLGTCDECRTWFLINAASGVIVQLPSEEELKRAQPKSPGRFQSGLPGRSAASLRLRR